MAASDRPRARGGFDWRSALKPWAERELAWALRLHAAAAYPPVVLWLASVSWLGDGFLWCGVIVALPWWGGANGLACAMRLSVVARVCEEVATLHDLLERVVGDQATG